MTWKTKTINWVDDMASHPKQSELRELAEAQKSGRIKVIDIRRVPQNPEIVVVTYDDQMGEVQ